MKTADRFISPFSVVPSPSIEMVAKIASTTRLEPFPNPTSAQPLGSFIMAERMFKFNSADNSKSDEEYPNEHDEGNHQCPSVFWSPRKATFQEDFEYDCVMFEELVNENQQNENTSMYSPISCVHNSEIINFASFGSHEVKSAPGFRLMSAGQLENETKPDFRVVSYPVYGGCKDSTLNAVTLNQLVCTKQSIMCKDFQLENEAENKTADSQVRNAN